MLSLPVETWAALQSIFPLEYQEENLRSGEQLGTLPSRSRNWQELNIYIWFTVPSLVRGASVILHTWPLQI